MYSTIVGSLNISLSCNNRSCVFLGGRCTSVELLDVTGLCGFRCHPSVICRVDTTVFLTCNFIAHLYVANKEASIVLCSVVKYAGSGRARKKRRGKHETKSSVFPHFLSALPLPKCFTTEQSTVEASLFVL